MSLPPQQPSSWPASPAISQTPPSPAAFHRCESQENSSPGISVRCKEREREREREREIQN